MENKIQNEKVVVFSENVCTNVNVSDPNSMQDVDFTDANGDVKYSGCGVLPNNNVCNNALSQCKSDKECVTSTVENCIMSADNISGVSHKESTSADNQLEAGDANTDSSKSGM